MNDSKNVYLDYNATTPPWPEVINEIKSSMENHWQNPSTPYKPGAQCKEAIEQARTKVGKLVQVDPRDIVFTSGGTESNGTVFHSIIESSNSKPHIITSNVEHENVIKSLKHYEARKRIDLTVVEVEKNTGVVSVDKVLEAIIPERTRLVSIMFVNNETGIAMPISDIVNAVRAKCEKFKNKVFIHSDTCQAIGKVPVDLSKIPLDYAPIAGHKFYGPRSGALYVRGLSQRKSQQNDSPERPDLPPFSIVFHGGKQEKGWRPGTENTAMIVGLGKAAEILSNNLNDCLLRLYDLRGHLESRLKEMFTQHPVMNEQGHRISVCVFGVDRCLGQSSPHLAIRRANEVIHLNRCVNTANVTFQGPPWINSANILSRCPQLWATRGAACSSTAPPVDNLSKPKPPPGSKVLQNSGYSSELSASALRLSVGLHSTRSELDYAVELIHSAVKAEVLENAL